MGRSLSVNLFARVVSILVLVAVAFAFSSAVLPSSSFGLSDLSPEEQIMLELINEYRASYGLQPLTLSPVLMTVADWMARDMADNDYFSHTDSRGLGPFERMDHLGYAYNTWRAENLAAASENAQILLEYLQRSPGHNENLLRPEFSVIGIASAYNPHSYYGWYWALEFGGYMDDEYAREPIATFEIKAGWNGITHLGSSAAAEDVLASIAGKYVIVYHWDEDAQEWLSFSPHAPLVLSTLRQLETSKQYWIYASEEGTLLLYE